MTTYACVLDHQRHFSLFGELECCRYVFSCVNLDLSHHGDGRMIKILWKLEGWSMLTKCSGTLPSLHFLGGEAGFRALGCVELSRH